MYGFNKTCTLGPPFTAWSVNMFWFVFNNLAVSFNGVVCIFNIECPSNIASFNRVLIF